MRRGALAGYSLIELTVAVAALALVALAAAPDPRAHDETQAQAALAHYAAALDYARSEALRTASVRGVEVDAGAGVVRVFSADTTAHPLDISTTITEPLSRQPYRLAPGRGGLSRRVALSATGQPFNFHLQGGKPIVLFDARGIPHWIKTNTQQRFRLLDGRFKVAVGNSAFELVLEPITGRVLVP